MFFPASRNRIDSNLCQAKIGNGDFREIDAYNPTELSLKFFLKFAYTMGVIKRPLKVFSRNIIFSKNITDKQVGKIWYRS